MEERIFPKILLDPADRWERHRFDDSEVHLKGAFWNRDELYSGERACKKLHSLFSDLDGLQNPARLEAIQQAMAGLDGNFAFILQANNHALACVDHVRSFPLFFSLDGGGLRLSCSAPTLRAEVGLDEPDETAKLEFLMSGYVSGGNTLFNGLQQLQGGEFLLYSKGSRDVVLERYCTFFSEDVLEGSEEDLLHEAGIRHERTFAKMIQALDGRQVCVPLSAGLDSRLVLGFLLEHKYDNIQTVTYGRKELWEVEAARAIAEQAGVAWLHVEHRPNQVKNHLYSAEGLNYLRFASGLASVPIITDNYALSVLQANRTLEPDCVIVNGQSGDFTTGGHLPAGLLTLEAEEVPASTLINYMVDRHYSLWRNLKTEHNQSQLRNLLSDHMNLDPGLSLSKTSLAKEYERFEWQERQCKYVVNGQRIYDWLEYDWLLPLWDMELFTFWREVPWRHKVGQNLFRKYLQGRNPGGLFNIELPKGKNYIPKVFLPPQMLYQLLASVMGLDRDWF